MNWFLLHFIHVLIKILIQEQINIKLSGPVVKIIETRQEINEEPRNTMRWVKSLLSKHKKSFGFIVMLSAVVTGSIWYSLWLSQSLSFVCESFSNHHYIREVPREYKTVRRDLMESRVWWPHLSAIQQEKINMSPLKHSSAKLHSFTGLRKQPLD